MYKGNVRQSESAIVHSNILNIEGLLSDVLNICYVLIISIIN